MQADLNLHWAHMSEGMFSNAAHTMIIFCVAALLFPRPWSSMAQQLIVLDNKSVASYGTTVRLTSNDNPA